MSNLNVEPGTSTLDEMIAATELGVLMKTNRSWSIDDSRNKFQFGCEWGRMIRGGKLAEVVRDPNYRGISATFWRSLAMVGRPETVEVMGTPYCGKGEPNQAIRVGHASPVCRFTNVDVFGAEK
jgi:predicted Zn-dependent protease